MYTGFVYGREEEEEEEEAEAEEEGLGERREKREENSSEEERQRGIEERREKREKKTAQEQNLNRHDIIRNKAPPTKKPMISDNVVRLIFIHIHIYIYSPGKSVGVRFFVFVSSFQDDLFLLLRREIVNGRRSERWGFRITDSQFHSGFSPMLFRSGGPLLDCLSIRPLPSFGTVIGWFSRVYWGWWVVRL